MEERVTFHSPFALRDKVHIGDDDSVTATVTAVLWRVETPQVEITWINNGSLTSAWVAPYLLRPAAERPHSPMSLYVGHADLKGRPPNGWQA